MKICILTCEYPPDTAWGGIANLYYDLAHSLSAIGNEVHVITQATSSSTDSECGNLFVHRVGSNLSQYSVRARANYNLRAYDKLKSLIRDRELNIIEAPSFGAEAFLYSIKKGVPHLVVRLVTGAKEIISTGNFEGNLGHLSFNLLSLIEYSTLIRADSLIVSTRSGLDRLPKRCRAKASIVNLGIDMDRYKFVKTDIRNRYNLGNGPLVLFVGRLETRKGVDVLLLAMTEVWMRYPECKLVLVVKETLENLADGPNSYKAHLREIMGQYNMKEKVLVINANQREKIEFYSACDLLVMPSMSESFGLVLVEAMACGKAVVASNIPSFAK